MTANAGTVGIAPLAALDSEFALFAPISKLAKRNGGDDVVMWVGETMKGADTNHIQDSNLMSPVLAYLGTEPQLPLLSWTVILIP